MNTFHRHIQIVATSLQQITIFGNPDWADKQVLNQVADTIARLKRITRQHPKAHVKESIDRIDIHSFSALTQLYKKELRIASYGGMWARDLRINDRATLHISAVSIHLAFIAEDDYYEEHVSPSSEAYQRYQARKKGGMSHE